MVPMRAISTKDLFATCTRLPGECFSILMNKSKLDVADIVAPESGMNTFDESFSSWKAVECLTFRSLRRSAPDKPMAQFSRLLQTTFLPTSMKIYGKRMQIWATTLRKSSSSNYLKNMPSAIQKQQQKHNSWRHSQM